MLQTHRSAIVPIQLDPRVILWDWVELAVNAPFFMLEIASPAEDDEFLTHIMTSNLNVLRTHAGTSEAGVLKRVLLLSPGYVNGSDTFQLNALESVLSSPGNPMNMLFNLTDGRSLHFSLGDERLDESQYTDQVFKRTPETTQ